MRPTSVLDALGTIKDFCKEQKREHGNNCKKCPLSNYIGNCQLAYYDSFSKPRYWNIEQDGCNEKWLNYSTYLSDKKWLEESEGEEE